MCTGLEDFDFDLSSFLSDDLTVFEGSNNDVDSIFSQAQSFESPLSHLANLTPSLDFFSNPAPTWLGESISKGFSFMPNFTKQANPTPPTPVPPSTAAKGPPKRQREDPEPPVPTTTIHIEPEP